MAFVVAHAEKYSSGACAGLGIHVDRKSEEHSNKNIDNTISSENVELVENYNNNLYGAVKDRIREGYTGKKAIRKDAVASVGVVCSASSEFFEHKSKAESVQYFKDCKEYFENKVGKENIVCAKIHFDEKTPHMHLYFVPLTSDGRLSAKEVCNREFLRDMQRELPIFLQEKGHDVERGLEDSTNEHISKKEYENNSLLQNLRELEEKIRVLQQEKDRKQKEKEELSLELEKQELFEKTLQEIEEQLKSNKKMFSSNKYVVDEKLLNFLLDMSKSKFDEKEKIENLENALNSLKKKFSDEIDSLKNKLDSTKTELFDSERERRTLKSEVEGLKKSNETFEKEKNNYYNYYQQALRTQDRYRKIIDSSPEATRMLKDDIQKVKGGRER